MSPGEAESQAHGRPNRSIAEVINRAADLFESDKSFDIAHYLQERGVSFSVIIRVMREPDRRRSR